MVTVADRSHNNEGLNYYKAFSLIARMCLVLFNSKKLDISNDLIVYVSYVDIVEIPR